MSASAGDLLIAATDRWMRHAAGCDLETCAQCITLINQLRLAYKVWQSSGHKAAAVCRLHVSMGKLSVLEWARERMSHSMDIAAQKSGADRDGWLEDLAYWREIVARLERGA